MYAILILIGKCKLVFQISNENILIFALFLPVQFENCKKTPFSILTWFWGSDVDAASGVSDELDTEGIVFSASEKIFDGLPPRPFPVLLPFGNIE